jgi:hypothetical protein
MADFSTDIDIDPSEYVSECSHSEIIELIEILVEDGHLDSFNGKVRLSSKDGIDDEWYEALNKLHRSKIVLTKEDEDIIFTISKKLP